MTSTLLTRGEAVEFDVRGNKVFVNPYSDLILKDLVALERKWGLI